jgi:hypothetical protein
MTHVVGKVLVEKESFPEGTSKVGNGHPWDTKKLRRLRRKQRRQLRALPSRVMAGVHAPRPALTLEGDGAVVELELRRRAKGCIEREGAADVLDELESRLPETLLVEALQKTDFPPEADPALNQVSSNSPKSNLEDASVHAALRAFATLAVMADRLSDDDYLDPRVR